NNMIMLLYSTISDAYPILNSQIAQREFNGPEYFGFIRYPADTARTLTGLFIRKCHDTVGFAVIIFRSIQLPLAIVMDHDHHVIARFGLDLIFFPNTNQVTFSNYRHSNSL